MLPNMFQLADRDNDGHLGLAELHELLRNPDLLQRMGLDAGSVPNKVRRPARASVLRGSVACAAFHAVTP